MSMPAIQAEAINTHYGRSHILRGVSFHVAAGETVSLLGRNGMANHAPAHARAGAPVIRKIRLNGADVTPTRASALARRLAIVPEGRGIFPNLTVAET
jgi:branched-chain amino acid transport system ATP-binding protein